MVTDELIEVLHEAAKRIHSTEMETDDKATLILLLLSFLTDVPLKD